MVFSWLVPLLLIASLLTPSGVAAQVYSSSPGQDEARQVEVEFQRGVAAADRGDWAQAERAFAQVCELAPSANALLNLATARYHQQKPVLALQALDRLASLPAASASERATAGRMRERVAGMLARLAVHVDPPSASVALDGVRLPAERRRMPLDPGTHELEASATGYTAQSLSVEVEPGEHRSVHLVLVRAPAQPAAASAPAPPPPPKEASLPVASAPPERADATPGKSRRRWLWALGAVAVVAGAAVAVAVPLANREQGCSSADVTLGGCAP